MTASITETELQRARWRRAREPLRLLNIEDPEFASGGLAGRVRDLSVRLVILPGDPEVTKIDFGEEFWTWWQEDMDDPATGGTSYWGNHYAPTASTAARWSRVSGERWGGYIAICRHGGLEMGLGRDGAYKQNEKSYFQLTTIVARVWCALSQYGPVLERFGSRGPWEVSLALRATAGAHLGDFGEGWIEPAGFMGEPGQPCPEPALFTRAELSDWPSPDGTMQLAYRFGGWIEDSWGCKQRRFLAHQGEFKGQLDRRKCRWA